MQPLTILIDGYNVSRNSPGMRPEDGVAYSTARDNLVAQVKSKFRGTPHRVVVVFDGDGEREVCLAIRGLARGQCVYSQRGVTADAVVGRLAREAAAAGEQVVVCTNDLEVRTNTAAHGATHASVAEMGQTLNAPDKYTAKRIRHSAYVRRQLEGDREDAESLAHPRKGNPRHAPKKQRGRGERLW